MAELLFWIAGGIAALAAVLAFYRVVAGPSAADRTVGLDGMTIIAISFIAFLAVIADRIIYIDVALVYGLVSFLGVVAVARYLERGL
ncbi:MAG: cation:proton antiporter [Spirochaetes bacterium]|nr:cation:proton antiporter [Spirochaetota bacterium]